MGDGMSESCNPPDASGELKKLRDRYQQRDSEMPRNNWRMNIYHPRHPLGRLFQEHHHATLIRALNHLDCHLEGRSILDVGCGYGHWLRYLVELGAQPENLTGVDMSGERLSCARQANPAVTWMQVTGTTLPFPAATFDIAMQVVVFSSILDQGLRKSIAGEILRVVKPEGYIFWIDHKKPQADRLAGFSKAKVLEYFPGCHEVYAASVHPRYFRTLYRSWAWLAPCIYTFTKRWCDSWFLIMKKKGIAQP